MEKKKLIGIGVVILVILGMFMLNGQSTEEPIPYGNDGLGTEQTGSSDAMEGSGEVGIISVTQQVTVDQVYRSITEYPAGSTALDALEKEYRVEKDGQGENAFITSINGFETGEADQTFWALYVNGEQAQVGAGSYVLQDGDEISWIIESY